MNIGYDEDWAKEYGVEGLGQCSTFEEGQVFCADAACPEGFCSEAWKAVYQYAFAFAHGVDEPLYYNDWIRIPGVAICACNDGIRPVTVKIGERISQPRNAQIPSIPSRRKHPHHDMVRISMGRPHC